MKKAGYRIAIVSGRPDTAMKATRAWLEQYEIPFDSIDLVRSKGEYTPDHILKKAWLRNYGKGRILFVVDDRQRVVDMWREEGVSCLQCDAWPEQKSN